MNMAKNLTRGACIGAALIGATVYADCQSYVFRGIGRPVVSGITYSVISRDGRVIAGSSAYFFDTKDYREIAWVWRAETGFVHLLGDGYWPNFSTYSALNFDGSSLGASVFDYNTAVASLRTGQSGVRLFPDYFDETEETSISAISDDGLTVVMNADYGTAIETAGAGAYVVHPDDSISPIGNLNSSLRTCVARGASADCAVVAGNSKIRESPLPRLYRAFRWTEEDAIQDLGVLEPADESSNALGVSSDGSTIVGYSGEASGPNKSAFRWTETTGMEPLQKLEGFETHAALCANADGSMIGGRIWDTDTGEHDAVLWIEGQGIRRLSEMLLEEYGIDVAAMGWSLSKVNKISDDGRVISGAGEYRRLVNQPFVINLDGEKLFAVDADISQDGVVDTADLGVLISGYGETSEDPDYLYRSDLNHDGVIDTADLGLLIGAFGASPCD